MNFRIPPTGEKMLFHPVLACPNCEQPLGLAVEGVYNAHGNLNPVRDHRLHLVCLYGCMYDVKVGVTATELSMQVDQTAFISVEAFGQTPTVVEGPRLCLACNQLHVKTDNALCSPPVSYCPTLREEYHG